MRLAKILKQCRVDKPGRFRLNDCDPAEDFGLALDKDGIKAMLAGGVRRLADLQERLYAQERWAVLIVLQAMDAAGKDSAIKHVMSGVNPQGVQVFAFKAPSPQELDHDFMWRTTVNLPERGRIGIFNRSYYEEVLVVRVHREVLAHQKLPTELVTKHIWKERFTDIGAFERYLARNGTLILKFFLHVSRAEQRRRFLERLDKTAKNWKFSAADLAERQHWNAYMHAYEEMIQHTATAGAPWYVVPADHKWFTRLVVMEAIIEALEKLDLAFPKVPPQERKALKAARAALEREGNA